MQENTHFLPTRNMGFNKMKKKVISILLSTAMTAVLLAGCGDAAQETAAPETAEEAPAAE